MPVDEVKRTTCWSASTRL